MEIATMVKRMEKQAAEQSAATKRVTLAPGQIVRQGDIYVKCLGGERQIDLSVSPTRQLAPGASKGSRHVAEAPAVVYARQSADPTIGPVIVSKAPWTLSHPEHADVEFPAGYYEVGYQWDPRKKQRVQD